MKLLDQRVFYLVYKDRLDIYVRAATYGDREYSLDNEFFMAKHNLHRYLVQQHAKEGFNDRLAEKMYDPWAGGELNILQEYYYIRPDRYPKLGQLHKEAEKKRNAYNHFMWDYLSCFLEMIDEVNKQLQKNRVSANLLDRAKKFVAFEDRLTTIRNEWLWEYGEEGKRYKQEENKKDRQYDEDFKRKNPRYQKEHDEAAHQDAVNHRTRGTRGIPLTIAVDEKYGYKSRVKEREKILSLKEVYFDVVEEREKQIYQTAKNTNNLNNYYRGIDQALREIFPRKNASEREELWKKLFKIPFVAYDEKPKQVVAVPKNEKPSVVYQCNEDKATLKKVVVPEGVDEIEAEAFKDCTKLEVVELPSTLKSIGFGAFFNCASLKQINLPDKVECIYANTFQGCTSLQQITLPSKLKSIYVQAFSGCTNLKTVIFNQSVKEIFMLAFEGCDNLKTVAVPKGCTYQIANGMESFPIHCKITELTKTTPPKEVAKPVSQQVVQKPAEAKPKAVSKQKTATEVKQIEVAKTPQKEEKSTLVYTWQPPKELASDFRMEKGIFKKYVGKNDVVTLPEGITRIWENAFDKAKDFLKQVTIPEGVTELKEGLFKDCLKLEKVVLPSTLKNIYFDVFKNCNKLSQINLDKVEEIYNGAFDGCDSLTSVTVSKDCNYRDILGNSVFPKNCKVAVDGVKQIQTNEAEVAISKNLPTADPSQFKIEKEVCKKYLGKDEVVVLPDGIKKIGTNCFSRQKVKQVVLPEGVVSIDKTAFYASELESIVLPSTLKKIGANAFESCDKLTSITLPDNLESIGENAFLYCKKLTKVTFGEKLKTLQTKAFGECGSLEEVVLPKSLGKQVMASVAQGAFQCCKNLKRVVIPEGICTIGASAFSQCENLQEVTVPNSLYAVGEYAFVWCNNLKTITLPKGCQYKDNSFSKNTKINFK